MHLDEIHTYQEHKVKLCWAMVRNVGSILSDVNTYTQNKIFKNENELFF